MIRATPKPNQTSIEDSDSRLPLKPLVSSSYEERLLRDTLTYVRADCPFGDDPTAFNRWRGRKGKEWKRKNLE